MRERDDTLDMVLEGCSFSLLATISVLSSYVPVLRYVTTLPLSLSTA